VDYEAGVSRWLPRTRPAEFIRLLERSPVQPGRGTLVGRAIVERKIVHIHDVLTIRICLAEAQQSGSLRSMLGVPLFARGARSASSLSTARASSIHRETDRALTTFADQR